MAMCDTYCLSLKKPNSSFIYFLRFCSRNLRWPIGTKQNHKTLGFGFCDSVLGFCDSVLTFVILFLNFAILF